MQRAPSRKRGRRLTATDGARGSPRRSASSARNCLKTMPRAALRSSCHERAARQQVACAIVAYVPARNLAEHFASHIFHSVSRATVCRTLPLTSHLHARAQYSLRNTLQSTAAPPFLRDTFCRIISEHFGATGPGTRRTLAGHMRDICDTFCASSQNARSEHQRAKFRTMWQNAL